MTRLPALDRMRGLVMVLMTVDHAADVFNRNVIHPDTYAWGANGASLYVDPGNPLHFLTRWITHLCAPTFVFLAGASLALSVERRVRCGDRPVDIDRHLATRGALIVLFELWIGVAFGILAVQVLYAIGASMLCMVVLRRLPSTGLLALGLGWIVLGELVTGGLGLRPQLTPDGGLPEFPFPHPPLWGGLLFVNGFYDAPFRIPCAMPALDGQLMIVYPLLPWLAVMILGWVFGRWLVTSSGSADFERRVVRLLLSWGTAALAVWALQRLGNGYGNFWLERTDGDPLRWLQVSKYPPGLAYYGLELGIMALCLAGFFARQGTGRPVSRSAPLMVFGQTALFFYLLHMHLMASFRVLIFGGPVLSDAPFGLAGGWVATFVTLAVLYPVCRWYRGVKRARPASVLRFV